VPLGPVVLGVVLEAAWRRRSFQGLTASGGSAPRLVSAAGLDDPGGGLRGHVAVAAGGDDRAAGAAGGGRLNPKIVARIERRGTAPRIFEMVAGMRTDGQLAVISDAIDILAVTSWAPDLLLAGGRGLRTAMGDRWHLDAVYLLTFGLLGGALSPLPFPESGRPQEERTSRLAARSPAGLSLNDGQLGAPGTRGPGPAGRCHRRVTGSGGSPRRQRKQLPARGYQLPPCSEVDSIGSPELKTASVDEAVFIPNWACRWDSRRGRGHECASDVPFPSRRVHGLAF